MSPGEGGELFAWAHTGVSQRSPKYTITFENASLADVNSLGHKLKESLQDADRRLVTT